MDSEPAPLAATQMGAPDTEPLLEPVDLDVDIQCRTPSGWPSMSVPPPLAVTLNGRRYTCVSRLSDCSTGVTTSDCVLLTQAAPG